MYKDPKQFKIIDLGLKCQTRTILLNAGLKTVSDIIHYQNTIGLTNIHGIGFVRVGEIAKVCVSKVGLVYPDVKNPKERWGFTTNTKPVIRVFIAQKMNGVPELEIKETREIAISRINKYMKKIYSKYEVEYLDQMTENLEEDEKELNMLKNIGEIPDNGKNERLFWLGRSIMKYLSKANFIYFCPGAMEAKGCIVEASVAEQYNIPVLNYVIEEEIP